MQFDVVKTLTLEFLGDAWKDCYLKFRAVSVKQARGLAGKSEQELLEEGMLLLSKNLIEGKGVSKDKVVPISKDDLENMPMEVINKSIELLAGIGEEDAKKKLKDSTDS